MRFLTFLAVLGFSMLPLSAGAAGQVTTGSLAAAVDSIVRVRMEEARIPGAAVVVVRDGRIELSRGYGVADLASGRPVDPGRTLFRIGSISKALTALAVLALAGEDRLPLEDPVSDHLPPGLLARRYAEPVRVRHLLGHTGGFDQRGLRRQVEDPSQRPSLGDFLRRELTPVRAPGTVGVYDTYGITLAGHLIERVTGQPYPAAMDRLVFAPAGMARTWVEAPDSVRGELAVGYGLEGETPEPQDYEWYVTLPASSVDATAEDMGRLLIGLLDAGRSPDAWPGPLTRSLLARPQYRYAPDMAAFSWGFWETRTRGWRALHHGGVMRGYESELYLVPEAGLGLFVAYNRDGETGPRPGLREAIVEAVTALLLPEREEASLDAAPGIDSLDTTPFAGAYGGTLGCFTCEEGEGWGISTLTIRASGPGRIETSAPWQAIDDNGFHRPESGARLEFLRDDDGFIRYAVQGPYSFVRLDDRLLDDVLGPDWRRKPPVRLVALVHRANERWEDAAEAYGSLALRHPDNGAYAYYEGLSNLEAGDAERARSAFRRALELGKWRGWSQYYIAGSHAVSGEQEAALAALREAVRLGFDDAALPRRDRWWDGLREHPEFREIMEGLGE